jgi:predicted DNA-binding protein with PD1-like motif
MHSVLHPGPVRRTRMDLAPCDGRPVEVTLAAGIPLEDAVAQALGPLGLDSAWLEIFDADVEKLNYVIPAEAPDDTHVAWYSDKREFAKGRIDHLGMIVGRHGDVSFLHGHGTWTPDGGLGAMGHILAPQTYLATPATARGIGLVGARFDRRADEETNFDLFHVDQVALGGGEYAAVRLLPNQDFTMGLDDACAALGWAAARVHGIGSVNTAHFENGQVLNSLPTEFLITDAIAGTGGPDAKSGPEIVIVGTDGTKILSGRLSRGTNAVLVTAELVLSRLDV